MPLILGVISDTHGLLRPEAATALEGASLILHAGDVGSPEVLAGLQAMAPVRAVRGNVDTGSWAAELPEAEVVEAGGVKMFLIHRLADLSFDPAAAGFHAVIYGHSHQPHNQVRGGVLYLNPGSAGRRRFRLPVTVARMRIEGDAVTAELIHL